MSRFAEILRALEQGGQLLSAPAEPVEVEDSVANSEAEMKPYSEVIEHTDVTFDMVPIPGGTFVMGSPDSEDDREDHEDQER